MEKNKESKALDSVTDSVKEKEMVGARDVRRMG